MDLLPLSFQDEFFELIEPYKILTFFRHQSPDGDAYGSSFGLMRYLQTNFPEKTCLMVSSETNNNTPFFGQGDDVDTETIKKSCAIVLDTANRERMDDIRALEAELIIKIDHHPPHDNYGHYNYVLEDHSSSCQIVAELILGHGQTITQACAKVLYAGMLTDTLGFSIPAVNEKTLLVASKLVGIGLNVSEINEALFSISDNIYDYVTWLRANGQHTPEGLYYCYIEPEILDQFNLTITEAKEQVNVYKAKDSAQIWCLFIRTDDKHYRVTMRSKSVTINDVARDFGGGGHALACATRDLTLENTHALLETLNNKLL